MLLPLKGGVQVRVVHRYIITGPTIYGGLHQCNIVVVKPLTAGRGRAIILLSPTLHKYLYISYLIKVRDMCMSTKKHYQRSSLRQDRHTISMITNHMVFTPKYRGKVLVGEIAIDCEKIIQEVCKQLNITILDIAVNPDHVHIFIQYPPNYKKRQQEFAERERQRKKQKREREQKKQERETGQTHDDNPAL
jgi:REP element-mobilizing transposase RayT